MDPRGRASIVRGLVAVAVGTAERGGAEDEARLQMIQVLRAHGTADPALVQEAAGAVDEQPLPPAGAGGIEGLGDVEDVDPVVQLTAMLTGREWLERFAADLAR